MQGIRQHLPAWWDPQHTYSGDSANLSLAARPGRLLLRTHSQDRWGNRASSRRLYRAGQAIVLTGALGPLLYEAVNGVMDIEVKTIAGGSQLTLDYKASGFANGGADKLAAAVDQVLSTQMKRFRSFRGRRPKT